MVPKQESEKPGNIEFSGQRIRSDIFDGEIYLTDSFVIRFDI